MPSLSFAHQRRLGETRQEQQEATGLPAEVLVDALRALVGRADEADLPIRFVNNDPDKITIGPAWASRCEDMGKPA